MPDQESEHRFARIEASLAATNAALDRLAERQDRSAEDAERWRLSFAGAAELLRQQQEENARQIGEIAKATAGLQKQWEAYLRQRPRQ